MQGVWGSFVDWLENLIRRYGLSRLFVGMSSLAGAALGLGIAFSQALLLATGGIVIIALLLLTTLAQFIDRRRIYVLLHDFRKVMTRYADELVGRQDADYFAIVDWTEEVTVSDAGNAVIDRWFTLRVGDTPLQAFWHRAYKTVPPRNNKYQRKVRLDARSFDEHRNLGAGYAVTKDWVGDSVRIFVHFDDAIPAGSDFRVRLRIEWPGYFREMLEDRIVEPFEWTLRRNTSNFSLSMTFQSSVGLSEPFRMTPLNAGLQPTQVYSESGKTLQVVLSNTAPEINEKFGFRLQRS